MYDLETIKALNKQRGKENPMLQSDNAKRMEMDPPSVSSRSVGGPKNGDKEAKRFEVSMLSGIYKASKRQWENASWAMGPARHAAMLSDKAKLNAAEEAAGLEITKW